ncbi:Eukaryotic translation initiation factor 5A {ECO:0000256/RuleBase:RU362005} Short=eIF-5A {ECO:0000256/RuleBase:RU362005} [Serendipita indica DSM 11827]|nr:Eukaryotic translation initiation factor 5A {ECO:0000256/RuleBase:RU362005} Short=eIF-5A {ECO:0000256/RuleBase:RU362005} [Serendipita indica DSM 11827]
MSDNEENHEHHFEQAASGASLTYPMQCSALRKNGSSPARSSKISPPLPTTWMSPMSTVLNCSFVNIDDGFLNLMTSDGQAKDDVKVPEGDLGKDIQAAFDDGKDLLVTIVSAMGEEQAMSFKEAAGNK